jgi:putative spermidine/putrescine transport system permease protein
MMVRVITYGVMGFLLLPLFATITTSFTELGYVAFPPKGFTLKWYWEAVHKPGFGESLVLSLWIALVTSVFSTVLGTLVAITIVRHRFLGRDLLNAFFMSPLILPTLVIGLALLQYYAQLGVGTTAAGLVIGHVIITTPYATRLIIASLTGVDTSIEWAAQTLGASRVGAFVRVTLPVIRDGMASGAIFSFIMSFENVTISAFLSTPRMETFPVRIFNYWDKVIEPWLIALASMVIVGTFIVLAVFNRVVSVRGLYGAEEQR